MLNWRLHGFDFMHGDGDDGSNGFEKEYQCYSSSFVARDTMESGNKVLLPQSAIYVLARLNISWPMLFEIRNTEANRMTHGGVLEFTAEEGSCYMPYWMMQNLLLKEGDYVKIKNVSLPKGKYVKLQPLSREFAEISNPKAVLETALRNYATLTIGDNILIRYLDKDYEIEVVDLKPSSAITIIETDVEVDFQYHEDAFKEIEIPPNSSGLSSGRSLESSKSEMSDSAVPKTGTMLFQGESYRLDGKTRRPHSPSTQSESNSSIETDPMEPWKMCLPGGVRTTCVEYSKLLREGRIPGFVGKTKGGASANMLDANFVPFSGRGDVTGES